MKRKIIFGTLVVAIMLLGTIAPLLAADDPPPICEGHQYYWVVHDDEDNSTKEQYHEWTSNLGWNQHDISYHPLDEIWHTAYADPPADPESGPIRPIRDEGWHTNTWVETTITTTGSPYYEAILHTKIYATPANDYPEFLNWTITNGNLTNAYFRIRVYEWDFPYEELCDFTHSVMSGTSAFKDKLGRYLDQCTLKLDYYDGTGPDP